MLLGFFFAQCAPLTYSGYVSATAGNDVWSEGVFRIFSRSVCDQCLAPLRLTRGRSIALLQNVPSENFHLVRAAVGIVIIIAGVLTQDV